MTDKPLTVEFRLAIARRPEPRPVPEPGVKAERARVDRAERRARNLALAHYIDHLIRSGEVEDLAAMAQMCRVSRARISQVVTLLDHSPVKQELLLKAESRAPERGESHPLRDAGARIVPIPSSTLRLARTAG